MVGWLWVAGQFTALGGGFLGLATSRALGEAFTTSPVPIAGSGLRTTGVYSVIRQPMYAAVLLVVIGVLIAAGSIWGCPRGVVIAVFFLLKSRWEDSLLRREYGASWEEWAEVTRAPFDDRSPSAGLTPPPDSRAHRGMDQPPAHEAR